MPKLVLFLCVLNRGRSVIAEHLFRKILSENYPDLAPEVEVSSAGMVTRELLQAIKKEGIPIERPFFGLPPHENIIGFMSQKGIDISAHRSRGLNRALAEKAALIITTYDFQRDDILSFYPSTKGRVFTFKEFVGVNSLPALERRRVLAVAPKNPDDPFLPDDKHVEEIIAEIEGCLAQNMPTFLSFLSIKGKIRGAENG
jgi:protein-tyrosine-phosphatase